MPDSSIVCMSVRMRHVLNPVVLDAAIARRASCRPACTCHALESRLQHVRRRSCSTCEGITIPIVTADMRLHVPAGSVGQALLSMLMHACSLEGLTELTCAEGLIPIWDGNVAGRLETLRLLNISRCSLSTLPGGAALGMRTCMKSLHAAYCFICKRLDPEMPQLAATACCPICCQHHAYR